MGKRAAPMNQSSENQRWWRILLVAFMMYAIAFVNRTNISLALPEIARDLHLSASQAGLASGIFFWGYLLLQIPGGYVATRWNAKRVIAALLVASGVCSIATGFVTDYRQLCLMRLLLGIAEGGVWPATLVLLSNWFPRRERVRSNACWMMCLPLAVVVSSPVSGWLLGK
jgi:sugar phosphate permease